MTNRVHAGQTQSNGITDGSAVGRGALGLRESLTDGGHGGQNGFAVGNGLATLEAAMMQVRAIVQYSCMACKIEHNQRNLL